ncbi:MAG: hypothetical protein IT449_08220 [Phycisphaerales bacterium]|nr:hypothetical protein [Phycisphaerales bacterium]
MPLRFHFFDPSKTRSAVALHVAVVAAWGVFLICNTGCRPDGTRSYRYRVAEPWELKGPFRAFAAQPPRAAAPEGASAESTEPAEPTDAQPALIETDIPPDGPPPDEDAGPTIEEPELTTDLPDELAAPGADDLEAPIASFAERPGLFSHGFHEDEDFWYLDSGFRLGQVRLEETSKQLDLRLDTLMALDTVHMFDEPVTPRNRKTDWGMTTQYLGLGRRETDWLTWNSYLGYGFGGDLNHDRRVILNIDVDFQYNIVYTGLTTDLYPWGKPKHANYPSWRERFYASRPFLLSGFEIGYVRGRGRGYVGLAPIGKIYKDSQSIEDWLFSYLAGLGWEVPIDDRWSFGASIHYTFHFYRPEEYNGYNITTALRYRF